jgi:hypothetical protein
MTKRQLRALARKLAQFASEYHSYQSPPELEGMAALIQDAIEEETAAATGPGQKPRTRSVRQDS